jgi:hypothetical protein
MRRIDAEEAYGYVCDCRVRQDPVESLCPSCRRHREDMDSNEEQDNEADVHKD